MRLERIRTIGLIVLFLLLPMSSLQAIEEAGPAMNEISNFRQYSSTFSSSGQPAREQFQAIRDNGFERIVYIGFTNSGANALADEDQIVKDLGMEYSQIPVDFDNPLPADFYAFADTMARYPDKNTLLHCQVNFRATAFSFLYRVIFEEVSVQQAKQDMDTVWQPNDVWRDFIFEVLEENSISPVCESCDWTAVEL
jgi:protein tyrosine phosphatase (PTP) superfamily phosphohydrolase (DUF442 family)